MKKTIYIIIIVIALSGALIMGYLAMTADNSSTSNSIVIEDSAQTQVYNILPEGKSLDFGTVNNFNKDGRLFPYPEVNPSEIGKVLGNLVN